MSDWDEYAELYMLVKGEHNYNVAQCAYLAGQSSAEQKNHFPEYLVAKNRYQTAEDNLAHAEQRGKELEIHSRRGWDYAKEIETELQAKCAELERERDELAEANFQAHKKLAALRDDMAARFVPLEQDLKAHSAALKAQAWAIYISGEPCDVFLNKQNAELECARRDKLYPDPTRQFVPLYTHPAAEPVAWLVKFKRNTPSEDKLIVWSRDRAEKEVAPHLITSVEPLYTHPAAERPDHRAVMEMALEAMQGNIFNMHCHFDDYFEAMNALREALK